MKTRLFSLAGALLLPALLSAGVIPIGSSTAIFSFPVGSITLPTPINSGPGSNISGVPISWSILVTGNPIFTSGGGPTFPINMNGVTMTFGLTDSPSSDVINATITLSSATNTAGTVGTYTGNFTDITGTMTYTAGTNITTPALGTYLTANLGIIPSAGLSSKLDLLISCGTTNVCVVPNIANGIIGEASVTTGTLLTATLSNAVPEPGTLVLLSGGLLALAGFKRFVRKA